MRRLKHIASLNESTAGKLAAVSIAVLGIAYAASGIDRVWPIHIDIGPVILGAIIVVVAHCIGKGNADTGRLAMGFMSVIMCLALFWVVSWTFTRLVSDPGFKVKGSPWVVVVIGVWAFANRTWLGTWLNERGEFSLRTLLITTTVIAVVLGAIIYVAR